MNGKKQLLNSNNYFRNLKNVRQAVDEKLLITCNSIDETITFTILTKLLYSSGNGKSYFVRHL